MATFISIAKKIAHFFSIQNSKIYTSRQYKIDTNDL